MGTMQEVAAALRQLCEVDADGVMHEDRIAGELDLVGGPDSALYGPIEDLDSTADTLDSAAYDIRSALGDGEEQSPAASPTACLLQAPPGAEDAPEGAVCMCTACQVARVTGG
jgi:hypothetical protein